MRKLLGSIWWKHLEGSGRAGQARHSPGSVSQARKVAGLRLPNGCPKTCGRQEKGQAGQVPRCWGGSQNNGVPCVWTASREVHIFHGDSTHENWQGEEKASGRVSLAPAAMWLGDALLPGQPHTHSLQTPGSWVLAVGKPWEHCLQGGLLGRCQPAWSLRVHRAN